MSVQRSRTGRISRRPLAAASQKVTKHTPLMMPARAFLYNPLGSRFSTSASGASTKTSTNGILAASWIERASVRSARYGEINAVSVAVEDEATSLATCRSEDRVSTVSRGAFRASAPSACAPVQSSHVALQTLIQTFRNVNSCPSSLRLRSSCVRIATRCSPRQRHPTASTPTRDV